MLTVTQTLLDTLVQIARTAGEKILEVYADESSFQVETKDNNSPLTRADRAAHEIIAARLEEITPEIPVLSEEGKDIPYETRATWERFWLVDPLDGTKEFIKRNGEFTVNIALIEGGLVVMGCVHVPVMGLTYYAAAGQGTWKIEGDAAPVRVMASEFRMEDSGLRIVCSRSHMTPEVEAYLAQFEEPVAVSLGSSLKLVMVAEGAADIYPRLGPTMEWDTAAAQILVEEAGGSVINHETGRPLTYNKQNLLNPYFIVFARKQG